MSTSSPAPVRGSTALPFGFRHRHASEEARAIAENGMILRVQVGSGVHGTSISGQDDRDEMGLGRWLAAPQLPALKTSASECSGSPTPGMKLWEDLPDPLALIRAIAYEGSDASELATAARVLQAATQRLLDHMSAGGE
jgi:hypothetical protein